MRFKNVIHLDKDSFFIGKPGNWIGVHIDTPWCEDAKQYGAPASIYIHLLFGVVTIYLPSKYDLNLDDNQRTAIIVGHDWRWPRNRSWSPKNGNWHHSLYTKKPKRRRVTFYPSKIMQCQQNVGSWIGRNGHPHTMICGAFRWHRGMHAGTIPTTWFETKPTGPRGAPKSFAYSLKTN
jgi:hypothetical protein